jgi:hypothetical protein
MDKKEYTLKAYKGFNRDMTCRGFQFAEGGEYEENRAELCETGFHACEIPHEIFRYYAPGKSVYRKVELGDVSEKKAKSKRVCKRIKIGAQVGLRHIVEISVSAFFAWFGFDKKIQATETAEDGSALRAGSGSALAAGDASALQAGYASALNAGDASALQAGYASALNAGDASALRAGEDSALSAGSASALSAWSTSALRAGDASALRAGDGSALRARSTSALRAGRDSALYAGDASALRAGDDSALSAGDASALMAGDDSALSAGYYSALSAGSGSALRAGYDSELSAGKYSVVYGGAESKVSGGLYSILAIQIKNKDGEVIGVAHEVVDGENIKADTFYKLVDGKFTEVSEDAVLCEGGTR